MNTRSGSLEISRSIGSVRYECFIPASCQAMLTLAHGAGAGMSHSFLVSLSDALAEKNLGTVRFNFPYMEQGKKLPDYPPVAEATIARMAEFTHDQFKNLPVFLGGKSFGGRMSSQYAAKENPEFISGIIFVGFPLHPAGNPSVNRAEHLHEVKTPMLFLQGTKDTLAEINLITEVCNQLPLATLVTFEKADHSFKAGKKIFIDELAAAIAGWVRSIGTSLP